MPTISEFFGILIRMYYDDHNPPHFHAYYGEHEAIILIETLEIVDALVVPHATGDFVLGFRWDCEER